MMNEPYSNAEKAINFQRKIITDYLLTKIISFTACWDLKNNNQQQSSFGKPSRSSIQQYGNLSFIEGSDRNSTCQTVWIVPYTRRRRRRWRNGGDYRFRNAAGCIFFQVESTTTTTNDEEEGISLKCSFINEVLFWQFVPLLGWDRFSAVVPYLRRMDFPNTLACFVRASETQRLLWVKSKSREEKKPLMIFQ